MFSIYLNFKKWETKYLNYIQETIFFLLIFNKN